MPGGFDRNFWTRVLAEHGLESPGYQEAVRDAREISRRKMEEKFKPVERKKPERKKK